MSPSSAEGIVDPPAASLTMVRSASVSPTNGARSTASVDYEYVISGSIVLELDDGVEVELHAGDTVVQNGTRHGWTNRGSEPCRMVVVLVGTPHSDVG